MEIRKCEECDRTFGYFDSPGMDECACGGKLYVLEGEELNKYSNCLRESYNPDTPTVSC